MELRKEYADIAVRYEDTPCKHSAIHVATLCQELADRPPRELSASEKYELWLSVYNGQFSTTVSKDGSDVVDKIIAAYQAKQREPESEPLDLAKLSTGEWQLLYMGVPTGVLNVIDYACNPERYTMRRKA